MERAGGQETGDQVDIPGGIAIWWHIEGQVGDDLDWRQLAP